jgi:hypothetical protein
MGPPLGASPAIYQNTTLPDPGNSQLVLLIFGVVGPGKFAACIAYPPLMVLVTRREKAAA